MIGCSRTRKLIDEADNPELFSYEAARHIASCPPCKDFAEERARLKHLLASTVRVSAPANFDERLSRRMAEVATGRSVLDKLAMLLAWTGPAGLMRFGAVTAVVVIAVFAASYGGLFSESTPSDMNPQSPMATFVPEPVAPPTTRPSGAQAQPFEPTSAPIATAGPSRESRQLKRVNNRPVIIEPDLAIAGTQTVIVRGENFEREVPMPTVSVGAQPLLYVGSGRTSSSSIRASF